jgi:hypothetical protein
VLPCQPQMPPTMHEFQRQQNDECGRYVSHRQQHVAALTDVVDVFDQAAVLVVEDFRERPTGLRESMTRKYATAAMSTLTLSRVMMPCD